MKNLPLILNIILFALVGHLYYLNSQKSGGSAPQAILPPASQTGGARIAYVNADTLDAKYEWLKEQKTAIEQRLANAEKSLAGKEEALMKDAATLQQKFQEGNMTQAEAEKQQAALMQRGQKLEEEKMRLSKSLSEDQKKAFDDLYANVEAKLKTLSSQIGYDYILSYSRGGQILMANDSLDITKQVLELLNAKDK
ncbi:MAG TPA: OmpH family outer membrane protein [Saprospiraceae bacterium]|nr:OmpH family outer membrane protein [Saprospiraceae bacterium]